MVAVSLFRGTAHTEQVSGVNVDDKIESLALWLCGESYARPQ